ncbi:helix-turn-helix transcriptional regulator [Cribrihabitans sp. XS_ASV171]
MPEKSMPMMRLSLLRPFVAELHARGLDPSPPLNAAGLNEAAMFDDTAIVHAMPAHHFVESCATYARDPHFAATVAAKRDPAHWPELRLALDNARSVADFLTIFIGRVNATALSAELFLEIRAEFACLGESHMFEPPFPPAQNDAYMAVLSLGVLEAGLGQIMVPDRVSLTLNNPNALPDAYRRFQLRRGDAQGIRVRFPSSWLVCPVADLCAEAAEAEVEGFLPSFRTVLREHVGQGGLAADDAARIMGLSRWKLSRRLAAEGTDISTEIARARIDYASVALNTTGQSIETIARSLGYSDASNFARAFHRATGASPSRFRQQHRGS